MSFGLVVAAQVLLFAGSNLPTPLFPIYEHRYGFGPGVVTLLFGSYIAILVPTLVLLGPVADRVGRRPLLVAGIAVTAISSTAFAAARSLGWLYAGELSYGIASALVMSCVSIAIRELHPTHDVAAGSLAASVAMAVGMVLGPLTSGVLADATPWPTTAPYVVDICLASLLSVALLRIPETRPRTGTTSARVARLHVPSEIRPAFAGPAAMGAATFMFVGWVFGLSPSFLDDDLNVHITRPLVGGLFAALVAFAMGASQLGLRAHHGHRPGARALFAVVAGMGTIAVSSATRCLAMAVVGGVVAGVGAGVAQMSAMAAVQTVAPPRARTGVMSTYVTVCYLALSVPVVIAGEAADHVGLATVTAWYAIAVTVVVVLALRLSRRISTGLCSEEAAPAAPPAGGMRHAAATA
ncbi:MAG TPA: MFS transporter [Acidimicrobiales bacterium]|nr:MFS transporter [Acidimicrobiales bacterium]